MISPTSAGGDSITMSTLADKAQRGSQLTIVEQGIVVTNAAKILSSNFGPQPAEFRISPVPLPENVRGVLAAFSL
jgi:hypothetical protein